MDSLTGLTHFVILPFYGGMVQGTHNVPDMYNLFSQEMGLNALQLLFRVKSFSKALSGHTISWLKREG